MFDKLKTLMAAARGAAGAGHLLTKPYSKQELLAAVQEAVERRRARISGSA